MTDSISAHVRGNEMACPTCGARQAWSDQCRRCKCDLSLLRKASLAREAQRRRCLREMSAGRPEQALRHARRYAMLSGGDEAVRLLGVCYLLAGDWLGARAVARRVLRRGD